MGKHRAGAIDKSLRFADVAMNHYRTGLQLFPNDGDLAYNQARLELEIATHPLFVKHIDDVPVRLQKSLASHRVAMTLLPGNADLLFNIAQALTMLAEIAAENDSESMPTILEYLTEALECQARCFTIQTGQYAESRQLLNEVAENSLNDEDEDDGGTRLDTSTTSALEDNEMEQRWVSVVESVTADTLLDTILAQLGTLTTLCSILSNNPITTAAHLNDIEFYSNQVNNVALPELLKAEPELATQEHIHDIALAQMNFQLNHTELLFHADKVNLDEYQQILEEMYNKISAMTMADLNIAFSRGLLTFSNAVGTGPISDVLAIRWKALSQALKVLADAAKLPDVKEQIDVLATTHLLRGDSSLMLKSLGDHPHSYSQAVTNASQLLKNAQVYYTNAFKLATIDLKDVCEFRRSIVIALLQSGNASGNSTSGGSESSVGPASSVEQLRPQSKRPSWYFKQLQDMMEDGLISESFATAISTLIH